MTDGPVIVSTFSGVGGLDLGVQQVVGGTVIAHVEWEKAPSRVLAHHWPTVPNLGDITAIDWHAFIGEHPELGDLVGTYRAGVILTTGFPCQDVSLAGKRLGLHDGTRSGLWSEVARAIDVLRPELVVIENVRGLLSAAANREQEAATDEWYDDEDDAGDLGPGSWGVGDGRSGPVLRALGAVLGDLAALGYDARWCGLRAADAGAPHARFRVFVVAYPRDASDVIRERGRRLAEQSAWDAGTPRGADRRVAQDADGAASSERRVAAPGQTEAGRARPDAGRRGGTPAADGDRVVQAEEHQGADILDGERAALGRRTVEPAGARGSRVPAGRRAPGSPAARRGTTASFPASDRGLVADTDDRSGDGREREARREPVGGATAPRDSRGRFVRRAAADADRDGLGIVGGLEPDQRDADGRHRADEARGAAEPEAQWGPYAAAIARWEEVTGHAAPAPTEGNGRNGSHRLSSKFVEWMMGYQPGHITSVGLSRNDELKALGNSVVQQQVALAVRTLLTAEAVAA